MSNCFWENSDYKQCIRDGKAWGKTCHNELLKLVKCLQAQELHQRANREPEGFPPSFGACDPMPRAGGAGFPPSFGACDPMPRGDGSGFPPSYGA